MTTERAFLLDCIHKAPITDIFSLDDSEDLMIRVNGTPVYLDSYFIAPVNGKMTLVLDASDARKKPLVEMGEVVLFSWGTAVCKDITPLRDEDGYIHEYSYVLEDPNGAPIVLSETELSSVINNA